jgi:hypothetical protein
VVRLVPVRFPVPPLFLFEKKCSFLLRICGRHRFMEVLFFEDFVAVTVEIFVNLRICGRYRFMPVPFFFCESLWLVILRFVIILRIFDRYRLVPVLLCAVAILVMWYPVRFLGFQVSLFFCGFLSLCAVGVLFLWFPVRFRGLNFFFVVFFSSVSYYTQCILTLTSRHLSFFQFSFFSFFCFRFSILIVGDSFQLRCPIPPQRKH